MQLAVWTAAMCLMPWAQAATFDCTKGVDAAAITEALSRHSPLKPSIFMTANCCGHGLQHILQLEQNMNIYSRGSKGRTEQ